MPHSSFTFPSISNPFSKQSLKEFDADPKKMLSERFFSLAILIRKIPVIGLPLACTFKLLGLVCKQMENLSGQTQKHDLKTAMQNYDLAPQDR